MTEASRDFSDLLDAIERGETVTITRGHHAVAEVGSARRRTGAELRAALEDIPPPDERFAADISGAVALLASEGTDPWGRRLILDTNALIAHERGTIEWAALDADELVIATVSVAEYRAGIELADRAERAADRARALAVISSAVDVLEYAEATAACRAADRACPPGWSASGVS